MLEKKQSTFNSTDLNKMQEVVIDFRTKIYIGLNENPELAREKYLSRFTRMKKFWSFSRNENWPSAWKQRVSYIYDSVKGKFPVPDF